MISGFRFFQCVVFIVWMVFAGSVAQSQEPAKLPRPTSIGVMGDSLSTGAATHPAMTFDSLDLWKIFQGETSLTVDGALWSQLGFAAELATDKPMILWPSKRDFEGGLPWIWQNTMAGLSRLYLNNEELSWSSLFARKLGVEQGRVYLAAENGARIKDIARQYDRILDANDGRRPDALFIFFTGNDLCGPGIEFVTSPEQYGSDLRSGLDYIARNGNGESQVYVLGFLGVVQILYADSILNQKVSAFGQQMTCKELRKNNYQRPDNITDDRRLPPESGFFAQFMPPNPAGICPTLFRRDESFEERKGMLANRIRDFRKKQETVVTTSADQPASNGVRFHFIQQTSDILFSGPDIAADCFHLSAFGQKRIADTVSELF